MQLTIDLGDRSYPVIIDKGLLKKAYQHLSPYIAGKQVCIVSNETIAPLYLSTLESQLVPHYQVCTVLLPDGEQYKNLEHLSLIFDTLLKNSCSRDVTLIALGGGVVGDMTGFAASSFMRGVDFIQIPSTLLSQVDSSVGGKTGVNHPLGKNMIGAFYQPKCVLADVELLKTLPPRELSAGLAEVIKYGFIARPEFITWLQEYMNSLLAMDEAALIEAVAKSCECKAWVVGEDEKEKGLRAILNLGHTFGHAIEAHYKYKQFLHGEAVAIGMHMALRLSEQMGNISSDERKLGVDLMKAANLPVELEEKIDIAILERFMKVDKKAQSGNVRLVLLESLGKARVSDDFPLESMRASMQACMP